MRVSLSMLAVAAMTSLLPTPITAECVGSSFSELEREASILLEGTVLEKKQVGTREWATTLDVHRVWKGNVPRKMTVYHSESLDGPFLKEGDRLIVFALRQTPAMRPGERAHDDVPLRDAWIPPCFGPGRPTEDLVRQLGRSRPPKSDLP